MKRVSMRGKVIVKNFRERHSIGQFSKTWYRFTIVAAILVLMFIASIVGLSAQTSKNSADDKKNQSSGDATEKNGFLGSGMSFLEICLSLGGIGTFIGGIAAAIAISHRRKSEPQTTLIRIVESSVNIDNLLKDKESEEFSLVEKLMKPAKSGMPLLIMLKGRITPLPNMLEFLLDTFCQKEGWHIRLKVRT